MPAKPAGSPGSDQLCSSVRPRLCPDWDRSRQHQPKGFGWDGNGAAAPWSGGVRGRPTLSLVGTAGRQLLTKPWGESTRRKPREMGQPFPAIIPCPRPALPPREVPPAREARPSPGTAGPCPSRTEQSREVTPGGGVLRGQDAALAATAGIVSLDSWG